MKKVFVIHSEKLMTSFSVINVQVKFFYIFEKHEGSAESAPPPFWSVLQLTRAPVAFLSHLRPGQGGGIKMTSDNSKTKRDRNAGIRALQCSQRVHWKVHPVIFSFRSIFRSPKVIEDYEILGNAVFLRKCATVSEPILTKRPQKKHLNALLLFFAGISSELTYHQQVNPHRAGGRLAPRPPSGISWITKKRRRAAKSAAFGIHFYAFFPHPS